MSQSGVYYDGQNAERHEVRVTLSAFGLEIRDQAGQRLATWPCETLAWVETPERGQVMRLKEGEESLARLQLSGEEIFGELLRLAPQLQPRRHRQTGLARSLVLGVVGIGLFTGLLLYALPWIAGQAATVIPIAWEEALGEKALKDMETFFDFAADEAPRYCTEEPGHQVLETLVARLAKDDGSGYRYRVQVLDLEVVNAFALPGGQIVVFRGLIEQADSPEEVAGILAHEMAHVTQRHGTKALLRSLSSSILLGLMFDDPTGGTLGDLGSAMTHLSYSRDAEHEADQKAIGRLAEADVSNHGLVDFFTRLEDQGVELGGVFSLLATHPSHSDRAALFEAAGSEGGVAMSETDWKSLREICGPESEPESAPETSND